MPKVSQKLHKDVYKAIEFFKNYRVFEKHGKVILLGFFQSNNNVQYKHKIIIPPKYPYVPPTSYIVNPIVLDAPHQWKDGRLCLFHDSRWNPGKHDIMTIIKETCVWVNKWELWKKTGKWVGLDYHDHKRRG